MPSGNILSTVGRGGGVNCQSPDFIYSSEVLTGHLINKIVDNCKVFVSLLVYNSRQNAF